MHLREVPARLACRLELQLHALGDREQARQREEKNNMAAVNKKNAARNFQNAFKNVGARPEGARTADDGVDPFSRRKTRPMNYWNTNKQRGAAAGAGDPCMYSLLPRLEYVPCAIRHKQQTKGWTHHPLSA